MKKEKVAILGASDKPDRYSYRAMKLLESKGHEVFLISPNLQSIEGRSVYASLGDLHKHGAKIDTLTVYVNPQISSKMETEIIKLKPGRVIFNPGSENPDLAESLDGAGIEIEEACTLVLLTTGQY